MANNPYVNKVELADGTSLIDISDSTVTADKILQGYTAYGADGSKLTGTATSGTNGVVYITDTIDEHGGTIRNIVTDEDATITDTLDSHGGTVRSITGAEVYLQSASVQPTESAQTVTPTGDYYALGAVNVGAIPSDYIGSAIEQRDSSDLTVSGATVSVPAGVYASSASKTVASGTEGTPTATKGAVSNHSVSVTPSVTNSAGYITGGTKTGTAVSVSASELVSGTKSINANGTGIDVANYASVDVSVPSGTPTLQTKSVSYTPTETAQSATVTADSGYDGLSQVNVSVGAIDSEYIGSAIDRRSSSDVHFFDDDGYYVAGPSGFYDGNISVEITSGTAGTPTATKGTVSNHSISVTPSVTNTTGYITGGTKTGTAVTVTASELASGNKAITSNGTNIDVVGYSTVSVDVQGGGGGTPIHVGEADATSTTASISFTGLLGEPSSFYISFVGGSSIAIPTGTPYKTIDVIYDGTSTFGNIATNTTNAQASYSTNFSHTYSNGTLTVTGTESNFVGHYLMLYSYGGGAVDTKDVQVGSGATSITFTGLEDEPVYWSCAFKSNFGTSSGYERVISTAYGYTSFVPNLVNGCFMNTAVGCSPDRWTASYSNGSLTITSKGTNNGGYFHQPGYYQLTYAYDDGSGGGDSWNWMGKNPTKVATCLNEKNYLKDTGFATWTPSTTVAIISPQTALATQTVDFTNYDYIVLYRFHTHFEYTSEGNNRISDYYNEDAFSAFGYSSDLTNITADTINSCSTFSLDQSYGFFYKYSSDNSIYTTQSGYGVYASTSKTPPSVSSSGSITPNAPAISARCNNTYFSTASAEVVNQNTSYYEQTIELWRVDRGTTPSGARKADIRDMWLNGF